MKSIYTSVKTLLAKNVLATLIICFCIGNSLYSQNLAWSLAPKYLNGMTPIFLPTNTNPGYGNQPASAASNMQLDAQNNILFFVVDGVVYKGDGSLIGHLESYDHNPSGFVTGASEVVIMPDPGNCSRYYIFASSMTGLGSGNDYPYYAIVDMSIGTLIQNTNSETAFLLTNLLPNGIEWNYQGTSNRVTGITFAASNLRSDNSRFVFISNNFNQIFRYKVTTSGIAYDGVITMLPSGVNYGSYSSEMELINLSNGNYRIATLLDYYTSTTEEASKVFTAELNPQGDEISRDIIVFSRLGSSNLTLRIKGLEFNKDGSKLYIAHTIGSIHTNPIEYYDFNNTGLGVQVVNTSNANDFQWSQIEMAKDGKLYLATYNRMATIDPTNNSWNPNAVSFSGFTYYPNNGVSYIQPSSNEVAKLYTLPDQIDGMDYTAHFYANPQCCVANQWYSKDSYTATANATWQPGSNPFGNTTSDVYIKSQLTIPAGMNITIKNMTIRFAPDAKVIIDRGDAVNAGGKLTLDNTIFTSDNRCSKNNMWQGVEVYGDPAKAQIPISSTKQGYFEMKNNSMIENSITGVSATLLTKLVWWGNSILYLPNNNFTGGIVRASDSRFRNNHRDIFLYQYISPNGADNVSSFNNCHFFTDGILNQPLNGTTNPLHVYLNNVSGVAFNGCTFENLTPQLYTYSLRGQGINTENSKFSIGWRCLSGGINCTNFQYSNFNNLYYGIYATSNITARTMHADRVNFTNNMFGVYLNGLKYAKVLRSNFQLMRTKTPNPTIENYGLYLDACDQYHIEQNTFTEYNDPAISAFGNTSGIVVNNSGEAHNDIYRNEFHDMNVGVRAQGINGTYYLGDPNASVGLQIKCNRFYNNMQQSDIAVTSGRIDFQQGYCMPAGSSLAQKSLAGNRFSHSTNNAQNDISVNSGVLPFHYAHHADNITTPLYYSSSVTPESCNGILFNESQACPSTVDPIIILPFVFSMRMDSLDYAINQKVSLLDNSSSNAMTVSNPTVVKNVTTAISMLQGEKQRLISQRLTSMLFDTTIVDKETVVNQFMTDYQIASISGQLPIYTTIASNTIHDESFNRYLTATLNAVPLAVIEPIVLSSRVGIHDSISTQDEMISHLNIYPNPSQHGNTTNISLQNTINFNTANYSVKIYDLSPSGNLWLSQSFSNGHTMISVPSNLLPTGFYVVQLFNNNVLIETKMLRVD